jgi:hypothetical protein
MQTPLFEVKPVDREFYDARLRDFLPAQIIDVHTHVWLDRFKARQPNAPLRTVTWPSRVALDNSIEDLMETYSLLFPGKRVIPQFFSNLTAGDDIDAANAYTSACGITHGYPALIFATPQWSAQEFENRILAGRFIGAKVYMTMADAYIPIKEMRIYDYLPPHQLDVLDRHGWIVMLHIPRDARLRDAVNLAQMLEIERRYPNVQVIIAHVGRAYCAEDVGDAFDVLAETRHMRFDFSANTNAEVFAQLLRAVGPRRVLFGSDLPILRMRMRRICENGLYINLVPRRLYGDVSGDKNLREVDGPDAERLTFFMYEELDAFRQAAEWVRLQRDDIEAVFYNNAAQMIRAAGFAGPL